MTKPKNKHSLWVRFKYFFVEKRVLSKVTIEYNCYSKTCDLRSIIPVEWKTLPKKKYILRDNHMDEFELEKKLKEKYHKSLMKCGRKQLARLKKKKFVENQDSTYESKYLVAVSWSFDMKFRKISIDEWLKDKNEKN